jgi:hypothetical protein
MPTSLEETVRVRVATVDCPGDSIVPSRFHVTVIGPFALAGLQLVVVMFKVSGRPLLVFLM